MSTNPPANVLAFRTRPPADAAAAEPTAGRSADEQLVETVAGLLISLRDLGRDIAAKGALVLVPEPDLVFAGQRVEHIAERLLGAIFATEAAMSFVSRNHPQQVATRGALDEVDDRRTPPELLAECMALAGVDAFDLDAAANDANALAPRWHTLANSALAAPWLAGRVWCNPPYSDLRPWVAKALEERPRYSVAVMLLPANRTEQSWWQDLLEPARLAGDLDVYFLRGRRRFDRPGWTAPAKGDRPPFGLVVVVIRGQAEQ